MFVKKVPSYAIDRLKRRTKQKNNDGGAVFVKEVPSHPRNRLQRLKRKDNDNLVFVKKVLSHPRDRLRRRIKQKSNVNDLVFLKKVPSHPRDRLTRLIRRQGNTSPKIELGANVLRELRFFDVNIMADKANRKNRKEGIFDKIIRQLPPHSNRFYIEHDKKQIPLG